MRHRLSLLPVVFVSGLAAAVGLLLLLAGPAVAVRADPPTTALYVAPDGDDARDCASPADRCRTIQRAAAVAHDGDEIRVAAGTYTGARTVMAGSGYTYTQVVIITRSLTLRGGYSTVDWDTSDPAANLTVIDAERSGRGISIVGTGSETVAVDGFTVTGGDYTGLGNPAGVNSRACGGTGCDCGGGLFAHRATIVVRNCVVTGNVASRAASDRNGQGGGLYLWDVQPGSRIENTTIFSNSTGGCNGGGGGIYVEFGAGLVLTQSTIQSNYAPDGGGGMYAFQARGPIVVETTRFLDNATDNLNDGGGALAAHLTCDGEALRLDRVRMSGNQAKSEGAAVYLIKQNAMTRSRLCAMNLLLDGNHVALGGDTGPVINVAAGYNFDVTMAHVTAAGNPAPTFLRVEAPYDGYSFTAALTNTLIASAVNAFVGRQRAGEGALLIRHTNTLTDGVATLHHAEDGAPAFEAINPLSGDSGLDANCRLGPASAAIDAGTDAGVAVDIDGDRRPMRSLPDVGADEAGYWVLLPLVLRSHP